MSSTFRTRRTENPALGGECVFVWDELGPGRSPCGIRPAMLRAKIVGARSAVLLGLIESARACQTLIAGGAPVGSLKLSLGSVNVAVTGRFALVVRDRAVSRRARV